MKFPILEEKIQEEANRLELMELIGTDSGWSLFRYGITGLIHMVTFSDAKKVASGEVSFEEFIGKYNPTVKKYARGQGYIQIPINSLEEKGIFVPRKVYDIIHGGTSIFKEGIELFDPDYINLNIGLRISAEGSFLAQLREKIENAGEAEAYFSAFRLVDDNREKLWKPEDLVDKKVAEKGFNLGRYMWQISVAQYFDTEKGKPEIGSEPVPSRIVSICRELIPYYGKIIESLDVRSTSISSSL
ncbi:hypothetical protein HYU22_04675 [Candidatus Woesearchaeota archaeon]|nr:hypothetical protein [Candidatus Woesearchaeota archaeon]